MKLDDKIVCYGMSCSGKTTFAKRLTNHHYYCFDALFHWHLNETLNLSMSANLQYIKNICVKSQFVLDGWSLSDSQGQFLPSNVSVYVIWAPYYHIIQQYRIPVCDFNVHYKMYDKWYKNIDYYKLPKVRYFNNTGTFIEMSRNEFLSVL